VSRLQNGKGVDASSNSQRILRTGKVPCRWIAGSIVRHGQGAGPGVVAGRRVEIDCDRARCADRPSRTRAGIGTLAERSRSAIRHRRRPECYRRSAADSERDGCRYVPALVTEVEVRTG